MRCGGGIIDLEEFRRCAERLGAGPRPVDLEGAAACSAPAIPGYDPGDSDLETRASAALVAAGLPPPSSAAPHGSRGRKVRIDLAYPELKIAIELDSWKYHGGDNLTAFTDDRARKNDLIALGWAAPSFTESMTDEYFVSVIKQLYDAASASPARSHSAAGDANGRAGWVSGLWGRRRRLRGVGRSCSRRPRCRRTPRRRRRLRAGRRGRTASPSRACGGRRRRPPS